MPIHFDPYQLPFDVWIKYNAIQLASSGLVADPVQLEAEHTRVAIDQQA